MASEVISHAIFAFSHLTSPRTASSSTPPPTSSLSLCPSPYISPRASLHIQPCTPPSIPPELHPASHPALHPAPCTPSCASPST